MSFALSFQFYNSTPPSCVFHPFKEGWCTNWGQLLDFTDKTNKFGLGFTSGAQRAVPRARAGGPPLRISNRGINAIEDSEEDSNIDNWIYPTTNGGPSNWTARDFMLVSFIPQ